MLIKIDDLLGPEIFALLQEHLDDMAIHSPPESVHALDIDALRQPEITFWSAWREDELVGCGAMKELDATQAEIKSMRTIYKAKRTGVGSALLKHILEEARLRGYKRVSLETGSMDAFRPAREMYARFGFTECPPFADYQPDPHSTFMTLQLSG
ncbi:GNAT family N-acetyltransferase [Chromatiales bacterium (ex Bugula neritina AB1)]|nr:GNAT family N-acetyltransferase [Chromatiales bacterium (ex Bugula neritina AB1)]